MAIWNSHNKPTKISNHAEIPSFSIKTTKELLVTKKMSSKFIEYKGLPLLLRTWAKDVVALLEVGLLFIAFQASLISEPFDLNHCLLVIRAYRIDLFIGKQRFFG